jgi:hypothetical protein
MSARSGMTGATSALTDAWGRALDAEYEAVYGYALLGPRLAGADADTARTAQSSHEKQRDALAAAIAASGGNPPQPLAAYPDLGAPASAAEAATLAARLEDGCAAAWRFVYAAAAEPDVAAAEHAKASQARVSAQQALIDCAVRATGWRLAAGITPATRAFPGL